MHSDMIEMLDLDGVVLARYWSAAMDLVDTAAPDARHIVDLGAGSGVGSVLLARRHPAAEVTAVDLEASSLARIREKSARIRTIEANLDDAWPDLGEPDLVWMSMSLHHLIDPDRALATLRDLLAGGGVLVLAEFDEPLRFLADEALEERAMAALAHVHAHEVPELGTDWPARLAAAGFAVQTAHPFRIEEELADGDPSAARYAALWLGRLAERVADELEPADAAALHAAAGDPLAAGLRIRGTRTVIVASPMPGAHRA